MPKKKKKFERQITYAKVLHTPTYCCIQEINPTTDKPPFHARHILPKFGQKKEIQSDKSQKRLQKAINWMLVFAKEKRVFSKKPFINKKGNPQNTFTFKLSFITLTLSALQKHSDEFIKEHLLQPFLYWMTRNYQASYTWKAEAQLNGNIHFHITTDVFIHWKSIRAKWNSLLRKNQYEKVYQDGSHDSDPNSTDVHCVRNEKDVAKYLAAYASKKSSVTKKDLEKIEKFSIVPQFIFCLYNPELAPEMQDKTWYRRSITGRLWGCSESLSKIEFSLEQISTDYNFTAVEKDFFHGNNLQRLSTLIMQRLKEKNPNMSLQEEVELNKKNYQLSKVFIHKNLRFCKLNPTFQAKLAAIRANRNFTNQTTFTIESLN